MATVTHSTVVVVADDGTSPVGSDEWNAPHVITGLREVLTDDRTYYVRTDGNDDNDGLANTAGGAFLTVQHACDVVAELDFNNDPDVLVTIQVGAGTFSGQIILPNLINCPISDGVQGALIQGDGTTSTLITHSALGQATVSANGQAVIWAIDELKLEATAAFAGPIGAGLGAHILFPGNTSGWGHMHFKMSSNSYHLFALRSSTIRVNSAICTFEGSGRAICGCQSSSLVSMQCNDAVISGSPTYSIAALYANLGGVIVWAPHASQTGSATGKYWFNEGGVIDTFGITQFPPGSLPGETLLGDTYNDDYYTSSSFRADSGQGAGVTVLQSGVTTVTNLPVASAVGAGSRAFVTDATATTFLSVVAGSGGNAVPVVSNGTNWVIG
jgi:hypothetical protein